MRIYKCYKNQENRRGPELIGKFSITDECKIAVGIDGNKIYLQARKNIGNALDKILHLAFNYNTGKFQLNQMHGGVWGNECSIITDSDLSYLDTSVTTIANGEVAIPNSPPFSGYMPVITGHHLSNAVLENVFYDAGSWRIASNISQVTYIRFYKYPIL